MGVDQLVTGGDVQHPEVESLRTGKAVFTESAQAIELSTGVEFFDYSAGGGGTVIDIANGAIFRVDDDNDDGLLAVSKEGILTVEGRFNSETNPFEMSPQDVRNISSPSEGWYADHDGSGANTEGLARYDGSNWISQVDGSTIT